jgi:hypothetical protein
VAGPDWWSIPVGPALSFPVGPPQVIRSGWASPLRPRWAEVPLQAGTPSVAPGSRLGLRPLLPLGRRALPPAGPPCFLQAGACIRARPNFPGRRSQPRPGLLIWLGWLLRVFRLGWLLRVFRPGWAGTAPSQTGLNPLWAGIYTSGAYSSSGVNFIILCRSWDASRLGPAHPPSPYAGLGTPLGSDQHIPPLLVSLILRRRIRLMTG